LDPAQGRFDGSRPVGVYVHFPFCAVRCPYCDFAVDTRPEIPHDLYADAVSKEVETRAAWFRDGDLPPDFRSLYFGGGTPGLWRPDALARVIVAVRNAFEVSEERLRAAEITVEANPSTTDVAHYQALRDAGVNRLSFGAQSFLDAELARLGRDHDAASISRAFHAARTAGFTNISLDLMFGVPEQTLESWQKAVDALLALAPEHVSAYALTIEKGTRYYNDERKGRLDRPDDDATTAMFRQVRASLAAAGYQHYEVSSYARRGHRAVHNQLYWTQGAYLGVGSSAASFRPLQHGEGGYRFTNPRATDTYLRSSQAPGGLVPTKVEWRSSNDLENEALWLALRTVDGIDRSAHQRRFGHDPLAAADRQREANVCVASGWLDVSDNAIRLTDEGILFADEVATRLWKI
jgi:oxygen-independent coproporphyrinogen-3 oxidase